MTRVVNSITEPNMLSIYPGKNIHFWSVGLPVLKQSKSNGEPSPTWCGVHLFAKRCKSDIIIKCNFEVYHWTIDNSLESDASIDELEKINKDVADQINR
eukprot:UN21817